MDHQKSVWQRIAVPAVCSLIGGLSYGSQLLFLKIDPGPLTRMDSLCFNVLVACIWISYARAVLTDPGHIVAERRSDDEADDTKDSPVRQRYCRKCELPKPPRAHHCRICRRCIPKMDHHCPWTANCVSHFTFPHFMRFLFFAVTSMIYLECFLYSRAAAVWASRDLRYDLGPSVQQLISLFLLMLINSLTLFMVGITFVRALYAFCTNVSTIESWEIERHEQLLRRAKVLGGYLEGPDGSRVRIRRHEFPFDIGIARNMATTMGTSNPILWLFPLARTPTNSGITFETNGFEEPGTQWPPPDPDRMPRLRRNSEAMEAFVAQHHGLSNSQEIQAFRKRQQQDQTRWQEATSLQRRKPFHTRYGSATLSLSETDDVDGSDDCSMSESGEEGWQDSGGNRLEDYGVDQDVEFYDEDDIPLAELLRKRQEQRDSVEIYPAHQSR